MGNAVCEGWERSRNGHLPNWITDTVLCAAKGGLAYRPTNLPCPPHTPFPSSSSSHSVFHIAHEGVWRKFILTAAGLLSGVSMQTVHFEDNQNVQCSEQTRGWNRPEAAALLKSNEMRREGNNDGAHSHHGAIVYKIWIRLTWECQRVSDKWPSTSGEALKGRHWCR